MADTPTITSPDNASTDHPSTSIANVTAVEISKEADIGQLGKCTHQESKKRSEELINGNSAEPSSNTQGRSRKKLMTRKEFISMKREEKAKNNYVREDNRPRPQPQDGVKIKQPRLPKRKVLVAFGYCGSKYHGLQYNPPHDTVESELFKAFAKAGAISQDNSDDPKKISLQRAARTDRGVHAATNAISAKLIIENPSILEKINESLPCDIRAYQIIRTNGSFSAYTMCDARIYEYLIPTFCFLASPDIIEKMEESSSKLCLEEDKQFWKLWNPEQAKKLDYCRSYRIDDKKLAKVKEYFKEYEGTHRFHNFTRANAHSEKSMTRYLKEIKVSDPKIINGTEWVSIQLHGQSFMLNQIRKQVGATVMCIRNGLDFHEHIKHAFSEAKLNIPKAPANGLLLERPEFHGYNLKAREDGRKTIDFDNFLEESNEFKERMIYSKIWEEEKDQNVFVNWVSFVDRHDYKVEQGLVYLDDKEAKQYEEKDGEEEIGLDEEDS